MPALPHPCRYVFLDRDGVINIKLPLHQYVARPEDLVLYPGAAEAIAQLNQHGMRVLVVTNQRGISLGIFTEEQLAAVHQHLRTLLTKKVAHLDGLYYCPHARDACNCRKPLPGMFHQAFQDFPQASPSNSILIGDSLSDIQAGHNQGMATIFLEGDPQTQDPGAAKARALATCTAASLAAAVVLLLHPPGS